MTVLSLTPDDDPPESSPRLYPCSDLLAAFTAEAEAAWDARRSGKPRGVTTGFRKLDAELGGYLMPGLHFVHGGTGVGKTAWALQAAAGDFPALFVSCEMAPVELFRRLTARITGTYLGRLRSGEIPPDEAAELGRRAAEAAPQLTIADAMTRPATPKWLSATMTAVQGLSPHALLIVDSLHAWAGSQAQGDAAEYDSLNAGIVDLRRLVGERRIPILATVERNRLTMKTGGVNAGAGSRKIEYSADTVLELDHDPTAMPNTDGELPVSMKVGKNRNGAPGRTLDLRFHGALQRYTEA